MGDGLLHEKIVLVGGGTQGIGAGIARAADTDGEDAVQNVFGGSD